MPFLWLKDKVRNITLLNLFINISSAMLMFVMWTFSHISHFVCVVLPGITLMEEGVLVIQRVKKEDEGTYECRASNDMGMVVSSASVHVLGEPQLLYFDSNCFWNVNQQ